ncbi:hypothetical protein SDJN02_27618, partial [Cucurbita argyrosperma subsp. argyrosperma]
MVMTERGCLESPAHNLSAILKRLQLKCGNKVKLLFLKSMPWQIAKIDPSVRFGSLARWPPISEPSTLNLDELAHSVLPSIIIILLQA